MSVWLDLIDSIKYSGQIHLKTNNPISTFVFKQQYFTQKLYFIFKLSSWLVSDIGKWKRKKKERKKKEGKEKVILFFLWL